MDARTHLNHGIEQLGVTLSDQQMASMLAYLQLIQEWNKAYNLVGTSNTNELIEKHLLDSLAIAQHVTACPVLDVGSGAGLPGIPLAIALPDLSFTLLDSNGKKARFMRQAVLQLKLGNVEIVQTRIEQYEAKIPVKTIISRAFAPLDKALDLLATACMANTRVQIMLGARPEQLPQHEDFSHIEVLPICVPGLESQRHLLIAQRN